MINQQSKENIIVESAIFDKSNKESHKEAHKETHKVVLEAKAGIRLSLATGELEIGHPNRMTTQHFYKAEKGSRLHLLCQDYTFAVATYSLDRDMTYIYTYAYQKEENWTTYQHDLMPESYGQKDYVFEEEMYFRVNIKKMDDGILTEYEEDRMNEILEYTTKQTSKIEKSYFIEEIEDTTNRIKEIRADDSIVFAMLTDSHYTVNGTWEDTADNIHRVHKAAGFDAIIHLGDFTDGMVSAKVTKDYVSMEIEDLLKNNVPLYYVLGNHDSNYFHSNTERMTKMEQNDFYFKYIDKNINRNLDQAYYYVDFTKKKLRGIFLDSYDFEEKVKYGFSAEELLWLRKTLDQTPEGYPVIVFSHVPPLARLHYWTDTIFNSDILMEILEAYDQQEGKQVLAFLHGHNHADQIYTERRFPIISIGCSKCEYFTDKKPEGSFTYERTFNTVTQELWDTMIITPSQRRIDFVRFGAGEDRSVK
ncbi:MAG: metallophosphoesterase [Mobilitalea sp.]